MAGNQEQLFLFEPEIERLFILEVYDAAGILAFGFKHPTQATLEGTEVIALKQLQLRAKDYIALQPADTVPVLEGLGKPPQSEEGCHE